MPLLTPEEFMQGLPAGSRIMALDVGAKTLGLATSVTGTELVMPLKTLMRVKFTKDAAALHAVMNEYDVRGLVIGWPLNHDGSMGKRCQSVKDFTAELDRFLNSHIPSPLRGEGQGGGEVINALVPVTPTPTLPPQGGGGSSGILITFWDERFSTAIGDDMVDNIGNMAGKPLNRAKRDDIIDSLAAQQILQDFILRF